MSDFVIAVVVTLAELSKYVILGTTYEDLLVTRMDTYFRSIRTILGPTQTQEDLTKPYQDPSIIPIEIF